MATWPSASKASTANVDEGSDKISLARVDIKQNIDNVNEIIDTFDIGTPNDGDLLQYSSSTGQWEQTSAADILNYAIISYGSTLTCTNGISPAPAAESPILVNAGNTNISIVAGDSAGGHSRISIPAGTWLIETNRSPSQGLSIGGGYVNAMGFRDVNTYKWFGASRVNITGYGSGTSSVARGHFELCATQTFDSTAEIELIMRSNAGINSVLNFSPSNITELGDSAGGPFENDNIGFLIKITKIA